MSETAEVVAPHWTLGWRLQRSLAWAGVSVEEMARELDVSRSTISRWCHDQGAPPRSIYLRAWSHKCRVPLEWLAGAEGDELATQRHKRPDYQHQLDDSADTPPTTAEIRSFLKATPLTHGADRRANRSAVAS